MKHKTKHRQTRLKTKLGLPNLEHAKTHTTAAKTSKQPPPISFLPLSTGSERRLRLGTARQSGWAMHRNVITRRVLFVVSRRAKSAYWVRRLSET
jgi:hypothetical protein